MTEQSGAAHQPHEFHPPVEEYLEAMLSLSEEGVPVIQARIAKRLGRSAPSVSEMLDRLREDGRWEHAISDDVGARLVELLGDPATCPHGNPIPESRSQASSATVRPLADVDSGERVRLCGISEEVEWNLGSLTLLHTGGFIPGVVADGGECGPEGNVEVAVEGGGEAIRVSRHLSHVYVGAS
jgi:DtxR family Mn-dependent transcriptional regulator